MHIAKTLVVLLSLMVCPNEHWQQIQHDGSLLPSSAPSCGTPLRLSLTAGPVRRSLVKWLADEGNLFPQSPTSRLPSLNMTCRLRSAMMTEFSPGAGQTLQPIA